MPELVRDFLDPADFYQQVKAVCGIDFYCGVPDSLLKGKPKERERERKKPSLNLPIRFRFLCLCHTKRSVDSSYHYSEWRFSCWTCLWFVHGHRSTLVSLSPKFRLRQYRQSDHVSCGTWRLQPSDAFINRLARRTRQTWWATASHSRTGYTRNFRYNLEFEMFSKGKLLFLLFQRHSAFRFKHYLIISKVLLKLSKLLNATWKQRKVPMLCLSNDKHFCPIHCRKRPMVTPSNWFSICQISQSIEYLRI